MNRKLLIVTLSSLVCAGAWMPQTARADEPAAAAELTPPAEVFDTGDHVAIIVRNAMADVDGIAWKWGKMRVPIDHGPGATWARSVEDATIKRIAVVGGATPQVMVMFRHGDKTAQKLTDAAEIEAVEGGFKVLIPRKETLRAAQRAAKEAAAAAAVAAAEAEAAKKAQEAKAPEPAAASPVAPEQADPAPAAEDVASDAAAAASTEQIEARIDEAIDPAVIVPTDEPVDADALEGVATASTGSSNAAWMGIMTSMLILGACGAGLVWMRRRNAIALPGTKFEVLGNQSLGGKSRLVLLGLGERRMLLAVGESGTTLVDKWSNGEPMPVAAEQAEPASAPRINRNAESPLAALEFDGMGREAAIKSEPSWIDELRGGPSAATEAANDEGETPDAESSAVSGLLELRRKYRSTDQRAEPEDSRWVAALAAQLRAGDA